jgi:hypothetical protein
MIVYLTFGFLFLAIVLYVVYRLARMSGGTVNQNAAPAAPKYDWQSVLGRTFERGAGRAIDEYFEDDSPPKEVQRGSDPRDYTEASLGTKDYAGA